MSNKRPKTHLKLSTSFVRTSFSLVYWDAHEYDQVSNLVQYRWGQQVIELLNWHGNETARDTGCGTGLLTRY